jgi:hypothetical protein
MIPHKFGSSEKYAHSNIFPRKKSFAQFSPLTFGKIME